VCVCVCVCVRACVCVCVCVRARACARTCSLRGAGKSVLHELREERLSSFIDRVHIQLARTVYIYGIYIYDRMFGDFPAKNNVYQGYSFRGSFNSSANFHAF